jgi:protein-tyrosine phosphatase
MIDLRCHTLSGIDDGSSNDKMSLQMARKAVLEGIHTIVATPTIKMNAILTKKKISYEMFRN